MSGLLYYDRLRASKLYTAPTGVDPLVYIQELNLQADAYSREGDFHAALRLLQKRLAVVSHYRGSRTIYAAQAMAKLAHVTRKTGNEKDAHIWAFYAMRGYAALMLDGEARHKQHIAESIAMLDQDYPDLARAEGWGVPDFTSGLLRHAPIVAEESSSLIPRKRSGPGRP